MKKKKVCLLILSVILLSVLGGCESLARKFTRKAKKTEAVEMVLHPEEYKGPEMTKEEIYRQYFIYWKSWHDELINALSSKASHKKKIDCGQEALKNLVVLKMLLVSEMQKNFDPEISKLTGLLAGMKRDAYGSNDERNLQLAERIKLNIQRKFVFSKVKNYLK